MADLICNVTLSPPLSVNVSLNNPGAAVPAATTENDFIIAGPTPFAWLKKTLAQVKVILGLGSAAYITLNASNRFVTDTEKGTWNEKADKVAGSSLVADTELALIKNEIFGIACSDETTDLTTGVAYAPRAMPFDFVATRVYGELATAATGNTFLVSVKKAGTLITNAALSIVDGAVTGETSVFAGGASSYAFAKGDLLSIVKDQVGSVTTGKGLIIFLEGYRT